MTPEVFRSVINDFPAFASQFLVIRPKSGQLRKFELNRAQRYAHEKLEKQYAETGKVRALILKGRQQGMSTMIQGRYFHKVITKRGIKAYILTHEAEATKNLFEMTQRYYDKLPPGLCAPADKASSKELYIRKYDSGYAVGTAGNKGAGRSQTIQLFHGCLAEGTKIFNPIDGSVKNIELFCVGDIVQTHTNKVAPISFISNQKKECVEVKLRTLTAFPLVATREHRFWTQNGWKKLEELSEGDAIGYPIKTISNNIKNLILPNPIERKQKGGRQFSCLDEIYIDYDFGRLIGLYLAEGHIKLQYKEPKMPCSISFAVHRKEVDRTIEWVKIFNQYFLSLKVNHRKNSLTSTVTIYGNRFAQLINSLCGRTSKKHLPQNWFEMGEDFCKGLLHAYIVGDGSSHKNTRRIRASSICSAITVSLRDLAASLNYGWASIEYKSAAIRNGRNEKERFIFALCGEGATRLAEEIEKPSAQLKRRKTTSTKKFAASSIEISNGYAWLRINSIQDVGIKNVYDFEVDHEDHSYCSIHGATHNSEVAFWPNAEDHAKGVLNAVSDEPGTEIILESTANGIGNYFHGMWQAAISGKSEYQAIFVPWYWQEEYTASDADFHLTDEEEFLMSLYAEDGLTHRNLAWRRLKISASRDYEAGLEAFKQEYPFTSTEAFLNPIQNVFINSRYVSLARKQRVDSDARLIIGVDVAIGDKDKTAIIRRKGRVAYNLQLHSNLNTMETAGLLKNIIEKEKPYRVYIDCIGIGAGVVDRLRELGYHFVEGINVARTADQKDRFSNTRAELWSEMRDWLYQEMPVQIPDDDVLHGDLTSLGYKYDSSGRLRIESKDDLKARGMPSPDAADALALTFYAGFYETVNDFAITHIPKPRPGMFI